MNPETQEKLLQLQKYQEQQLRDPVSQPTVPTSPVKKRTYEADTLSEFEPPKKLTERKNSGYFYIFLIKTEQFCNSINNPTNFYSIIFLCIQFFILV